MYGDEENIEESLFDENLRNILQLFASLSFKYAGINTLR